MKKAKENQKTSSRKRTAGKKVPDGKHTPSRKGTTGSISRTAGPLTLTQARALVLAQETIPKHTPRRSLAGSVQSAFQSSTTAIETASIGKVGNERRKLRLKRRQETRERIRDYTATLTLLKQRGVKGLSYKAVRRRAPGATAVAAPSSQPLQILAEGDSWFDYPPFLLSGGIIPRLESRIGVPILNIAKAGDEVRYMLGVEERALLAEHLKQGCPAGGPWDALLFSGGGNDIIDNPMALWIKDYNSTLPASSHIHQQRFNAVLNLVRAGYEDLIIIRDTLSPSTHIFFHTYDFAIPDGRGVCFLGPWLKPTFDLRGFKTRTSAFEVVKEMLKQFADMLQTLVSPTVTLINTQATLSPQTSSWHNELHPSKEGFEKFADIFHQKLKTQFPGRVL